MDPGEAGQEVMEDQPSIRDHPGPRHGHNNGNGLTQAFQGQATVPVRSTP